MVSAVSNKLFQCLTALLVVLTMVCGVSTQASQSKLEQEKAAKVARAKELIRQSREAAGLDAPGGGVQTLSFKADADRFVKYFSVQSPIKVVENEKKLDGKIEAEFSLPDKFRLRTKSSLLSGFNMTYTEILNGDLAWRDPPMQVRSFGPDRRVIDVGDVERTMLMQTRTAKQQVAMHTLGWLLQTPTSVPVEMIHAGVVEVEGQKCEAIMVEGQEGFQNVLLLDQKTRLLFGLAIVFFDSIRETVVVEVSALDRRFIRDTYMRARQERAARTHPAQRHDLLWRFMDHSSVGGVTLPHRVKITLDGNPLEELKISEYKVNQPINPKRFDGKPEVKY